MKYVLAIDIGASSGRHIAGWLADGRIRTKEVYRFPNSVTKKDGHLTWDIAALLQHVKTGIAKALEQFPHIETLSIDTWGVDYVLLGGDEEILPVYAYRDSRTDAVIPRVHEKIPFPELYRRTGCQFQSFNSIYQLCDDLERGRLAEATDLLMIPDYLMYKLTGIKAREYTNATTMGLVNAKTGAFDPEIIDRLGLPGRLFPGLSRPGTVLGNLRPEVAAEVGGTCQVMLCATHDTASAVEGIPMEGNNPYISSGTWSLLGVKTPAPLTDRRSEAANYSNEGGVGYNRYQKNIMGMWLANELRRDLCPNRDFDWIVRQAMLSRFDRTVDADSPDFLAPASMKAAFDSALRVRGLEVGDYFRCAYRSLACSYRRAIDELESNTGIRYDRLYIVGGGAKNTFLNRLTEETTGKQVVALPIEATAIGNLKIQLQKKEEESCIC